MILEWQADADILQIKTEVAKKKLMLHELYDTPIILEPVPETVVPTIHVPNIWAILEPRVKGTQEEKEVRKKIEEEKEIKKMARAECIESERNWETRVHKIASVAGGSRTPVVYIKGDGFVPPSIADSSIPVDNGMIIEESESRPKGPPTDFAESVP